MLPHHRTMVANLKRLYRRSTAEDRYAGVQWYPSARRIVREWATHYHYHDSTVACVIAAISPQCPWERNLVIAPMPSVWYRLERKGGQMTRIHFTAAAQQVAAIENRETAAIVASYYADLFTRFNPLFNRAKFLSACGFDN